MITRNQSTESRNELAEPNHTSGPDLFISLKSLYRRIEYLKAQLNYYDAFHKQSKFPNMEKSSSVNKSLKKNTIIKKPGIILKKIAIDDERLLNEAIGVNPLNKFNFNYTEDTSNHKPHEIHKNKRSTIADKAYNPLYNPIYNQDELFPIYRIQKTKNRRRRKWEQRNQSLK